MQARSSILASGVLAAFAGVTNAQPPNQQQPVPPTTPPPETPPANWAPPLPQEPPATPPPNDATAVPAPAPAPAKEDSTKFEIYGFVMLDGGYDFGHIGNPDWFDTERPTKLPAFEDQFGRHGRTFAGVRQTRFGVKTTTPTSWGDMKTQFEWEMFGTGVDAGQTTIRLRHAVGEWRSFRAGQTWSPFMDIDIFPNSIEYWGPNGMPFFRNVQIAWMPIQGDSRVTIALERPGASADLGNYADRVELENVVPRFPAPDLSAEGRYGGSWGYVELSGILRYLRWDDLDPAPPRLSGDAVGWGLHLSSNLKVGDATFRLSAVYGEAIENYMNDAPADIGPVLTGDPDAPLDGEALGCLGLVAFVDMNWSERYTSSAGWSMVWIDNSEQQAPDAFHVGHYALANLLYHPTKDLMMGAEFQFGRRENFDDDWTVNDFRLQVSVKYNFAKTWGGE